MFPFVDKEISRMQAHVKRKRKGKSEAYYQTRARSLHPERAEKQATAFSQLMSSKNKPEYGGMSGGY